MKNFNLDNYIKTKYSKFDLEYLDEKTGELWREDIAQCESPIEQMFYLEFLRHKSDDIDLFLQQKIILPGKKIRVDFIVGLLPPTNGEPLPLFVVELDGKQHNDKDLIYADKQRDRDLMVEYGLPVIRFVGAEVFESVNGCVYECFCLCNSLKEKMLFNVFQQANSKLNPLSSKYFGNK